MTALYTPECEPAHATAEAIAESLDIKLKKLRDMENLDHGLWQGLCIEEVKRKQPTVYRQWQEQPASVRPPEGETLGEAEDRVNRAVEKLLKRHRTGVIGIVMPEPMATLVKVRLGKGKLGDLWATTAGHGDYLVLEIEPNAVAADR